jgi:hypothetical protein
MASDWTPARLLETWGLYQGKEMYDGLSTKEGDSDCFSDEQQAAKYVEATPGFMEASHVLQYRYVALKDLRYYRAADPGMDYNSALIRRKWGYCLGYPPALTGHMVHQRFVDALADRVRSQPFLPWKPSIEDV